MSTAELLPTLDTFALLEEFAATIAHELRTPLAIVEQTADTSLERGDDLSPEQMAEMLRIIQRNSSLATMLLARFEQDPGRGIGRVPLELGSIDLAEVTRQATFDLAEVLLRWHPTEVHAPASVMVHTDTTAVREILSNLLSNAVRYSPRGSYIDASVTRHQTEPDDRGAGPGLGLYVSRRLARALGGDLDVRPATRRGSVFCLTLPRAAEGGWATKDRPHQ